MSLKFYIRILKFEDKTIDSSWGSREHCEPFWRLYINKCNGAGLGLAGGNYPITANRVHFVPAWVRFRCRNTRELRHFYVHFELVGISSSLQREVFNRPFTSDEKVDYDRIADFPLKNFTPETPTDLKSLCYIKSLVYREFTALLLRLPPDQSNRLEHLLTADHAFSQVLHYIDNHLSEPINNDRLADLACLSKSHFIRSFHKALGQTPADYIQERRVAAAALTLNTSDESIDRIAEQHGFANRFYFSRVFRKIMGISPATYRKNPAV
jgi:AraC-like DNA-binding protein